jgi:hypothetical protein
MGWPYKFITLDEADRHARRLTLDRYASYAQLSSLIPVALVLLYRIARWSAKSAASRGSYNAIPNSPALKFERESERGVWRTQYNKLRWWLAGDLHLFGQLYGQRDQWVFGGLWTAWLLFLCIAETGQGESREVPWMYVSRLTGTRLPAHYQAPRYYRGFSVSAAIPAVPQGIESLCLDI